MTKCWFCGNEMIWDCDFSFEDYGIGGEGTVATLSCPECGASADFYSRQEEEEEL